MMRVLHVVASNQRRGAEVFTADLVGALAQAGIDQRVAVLRTVGGPAVDYGVPVWELGADPAGLSRVRVVLRALRRLRREMATWRPDLIQAHGGEPLKYAIPTAAAVPVVYRRIGSAVDQVARGPRRVLYGALMRRAARVVAVAEAVRLETMEVFQLPVGHVVTIPNAVDARRLAITRDRTTVRRDLGIAADAEVVLSLGALTWEKDPLAHLRIAAAVLVERPAAVHLLVGDGPMRAEVERQVVALGNGPRVRLAGARDDVPALLAASDVVLFASCSEGMPATVIEAGALGLPVAGYAVAGVAEVVEDGVTGLLAPPGDAAQLQDRLGELLADPSRRRGMGAAARGRCLGQFDITAIAPRYLELYRSLVASSPAERPA